MARGQLEDAVAETDPRRALARGAEEHLGRRHVRILLEEMVLDDPRVVVAEPVGELDLREHVLEQPILALRRPGPRQLRLVEDAEFHRSAAVRVIAWRPARWRRSCRRNSPGCRPQARSRSFAWRWRGSRTGACCH